MPMGISTQIIWKIPIMIATANAQAVVSSSSTGCSSAHNLDMRRRPTQKAPGVVGDARRPYRRYALRLYHNKRADFDLILILILIDRLSHFAVFPSNEISKKLEKELERRAQGKGKKGKEEGKR